MFSALDYRSMEWSGFEPWSAYCVVFLGKTLTLIVPLFTQVYKWVLVKLMPRA